MTKYFCDICEKELYPTEVSYQLTLEGSNGKSYLNKEICQECAKNIQNIIKGLNKTE